MAGHQLFPLTPPPLLCQPSTRNHPHRLSRKAGGGPQAHASRTTPQARSLLRKSRGLSWPSLWWVLPRRLLGVSPALPPRRQSGTSHSSAPRPLRARHLHECRAHLPPGGATSAPGCTTWRTEPCLRGRSRCCALARSGRRRRSRGGRARRAPRRVRGPQPASCGAALGARQPEEKARMQRKQSNMRARANTHAHNPTSSMCKRRRETR
mmetsp:Transcript_22258/g.45784  ORF Transcript_22258/g.45784 Transcript_22258/m.45784 type:complete len:209 (+) Transcript_22258:137-763(+)